MDWEANSGHLSRLFVPRDDKIRSFSTSTPFLHPSSEEFSKRSLSVSVESSTCNDSGLGASWSDIPTTSFADCTQTLGNMTVSVCQTPSFSVNTRLYEGRKLDLSGSPLSRRSYLARRSLESDLSFDDHDISNATLNSSNNRSFARKLDLDMDIDEGSVTWSEASNIHKPELASSISENLTHNSQESQLVSQFNEILEKFSPIECDRLIGRKMGRGRVDILGELNSRNIECISTILAYLDPKDLCSMCLVSRDWRIVCENNTTANLRRRKFIKQKRKASLENGKENFGKKPLVPANRVVTESGVLQSLATVQLVGDNLTMPLPARCHTTADHFIEAAKTLINEEILQKCPKCRKPAKVHPVQERGKCQNSDCSYDYCVNCLYEFHGSKECIPIGSKRTKTDAIGTKKSKKNLKRL